MSYESPKLALYYDKSSPFCRIVLSLAKYHDVPLEHHPISLYKNERFNSTFLDINPHNTVPTLVNETDHVVMNQSSSILLYLGRLFDWNGRYGIGSTPVQQARIMNALISNSHHIINQIYPITTQQVLYAALYDEPFNINDLKNDVNIIKKNLLILSSIINKNNGSITGELSIADAHVALLLSFIITTPTGLGLIDLDEYPIIKSWYTIIYNDLWCHEEFDEICTSFATMVSEKVPGSRLGESNRPKLTKNVADNSCRDGNSTVKCLTIDTQ